MRNISMVVGVAGLVGFFSACSGSDRAGVIQDPATGGSSKGGARPVTSGGKSGSATVAEGGAGGAAEGDSLAPSIEITSPVAVSDPNEDGVLTGDKVTVTCLVKQSPTAGSSKVNAAAVKLAIVDNNDEVVEEKIGTPTANADEYSNEFGLTALEAGALTFRCSAEDTAKHTAAATISTLFDKGPTITFVKPASDSLQNLSSPLDIEFTVEAAPLSKTDKHSAVDKVALAIAGQSVDVSRASDAPGHYRLQINLADPKLFSPSPNGVTPVVVEATNRRTPEAVKASKAQMISVDGAGPVIAVSSPTDKAVVGGRVTLKFTVKDEVAGVDPNSVVVSLNQVAHTYAEKSDSWTHSGDSYSFSFDTRMDQKSKVQITVNIGATDRVGNVSTGASELLYIDNYPPLIDLDPLNIRVYSTLPTCSSSFDPVGELAKNDLDIVKVAGLFRAVVWDQTNSVIEIPIQHFANTDPGSVQLYFEAQAGTPLLVDTDHDGSCNDVAEIESTDSLELTTIPFAGSAPFRKDDAVFPSAASLGCNTADGPDQLGLCDQHASDMTIALKDVYNNTPVIYGASVTPGLECTGVSWEFGTKVNDDGWVCFATRAVDNAGNVGVSRPIRICIDSDERGVTPPCAISSTEAPTCTDGCTVPGRWGGGLIKQ